MKQRDEIRKSQIAQETERLMEVRRLVQLEKAKAKERDMARKLTELKRKKEEKGSSNCYLYLRVSVLITTYKDNAFHIRNGYLYLLSVAINKRLFVPT